MGRGNRGGGRGGAGRGRGRGRGGHFQAFSGVGQVLGGAAGTSSGSDTSYYERGFGAPPTARPGRGGSLAARNQNAVPFDYSQLSKPSYASDSSSSGVDPKMRSRPSDAGPSRTPIVPPSAAGLASSPAGRSPFAKGRYVREPDYPAFITSRGNAVDGGSRPPEAAGDAKYLAAIPGRSSAGFNKKSRKPLRFGDPADRNPHLTPVSFVQASGEWKDGQWTGKQPTTDEDKGKAVEGSQSRFDAINARPSGAGLGFAAKPSQVQSTMKDWSTDEPESSAQEDLEGEDQLAALLKAFPGSQELHGTDDSGLGHVKSDLPFAYPGGSQSLPARSTQEAHPAAVDVTAPSAAEVTGGTGSADVDSIEQPAQALPTPSPEISASHHNRALAQTAADVDDLSRLSPAKPDRAPSPSSDDDEEMIVVGQPGASLLSESTSARLTAQSDSEEDRQLDAIIAGHTDASASSEKIKTASDGPAFTMDFTGEPSSGPAPVSHTSKYILGDEQEWEDALEEHGVAGSDARGSDVDPQAQYSHILEESSEDDFLPLPGSKAMNARGAIIGAGRKARIAAKKARRRARKGGQVIGGDEDGAADGIAASINKQQKREPRTGDSDLEWGSDGPPDLSIDRQTRRRAEKEKAGQRVSKAASGSSAFDLHLDHLSLDSRGNGHNLPQSRADEERMLQDALALSVTQSGGGPGQPRSGVQHSAISVKAPPRSKRGMSKRQMDQEAILADYMENALFRKEVDSDADEVDADTAGQLRIVEDRDSDQDETTTAKEMDAMLKFMRGMDGQQGGRQMTLGDIEDEQKMMEEDEWMTDSGDSELEDASGKNDGAPPTANRELDAALDASERQEIGESDASGDLEASDSESDSYDDDEDEDDEDDDEEGGLDIDSSDMDSEDEDGRIFDRNFSWAAEDEEYIQKIERFARANEDILHGKDRQARNKLFKAIEQGDFGEYEGTSAGDLADILDAEEADLAGLHPAKKSTGKKGKQRWAEDALWANQLQSQWEKDRAKKAANKRKRAEERRAAAQNPYPTTSIKKGTKKMAKKAARAARRQGGAHTDEDEVAEWDPAEVRGAQSTRELLLGASGPATNLRQLDNQILAFLDDDGHTTMSLPPMEKRSRAQVHMLAEAYSLKSKSRGTGRSRFTTLIKTKHSGVQVDTRKVARIIAGRGDASFGVNMPKGGKKSGKASGGSGAGRGGGQGGSHVAPNKEGAEVGFGADKIGADNIGHRLLSAMGWSEGMGVGASGVGMSNPVNATIKVTKGGLGF